jgi:hypothetical protein
MVDLASEERHEAALFYLADLLTGIVTLPDADVIAPRLIEVHST